VYHLLPVSLDCPFLITSSVFSNVYLSVSLDCPFLIAPTVFSNISNLYENYEEMLQINLCLLVKILAKFDQEMTSG
jgi:hypothetical protein